MKTQRLINRPWLEDLVALIFKAHPVVLYMLGWLNANESFLVLILGYLIFALRIQAWSAYSFYFDYKTRVWTNAEKGIWAKLLSAIGYLLGFIFVCSFWLFIYLIFFGIYFDAVVRQIPMGEPGIFDGESGRILIQTLWINGIFFLLLETIHLVKQIRRNSIRTFEFARALMLDTPVQSMNKWSALPMFWLIFCSMGFIILLSGMAYEAAIGLYFIFDIGFTFFKRLERRKNAVQSAY
jgi:hypothetical protein